MHIGATMLCFPTIPALPAAVYLEQVSLANQKLEDAKIL